MRRFEKISFEQFKKDVVDDIYLYNQYSLPKEVQNVQVDMIFMRFMIIH